MSQNDIDTDKPGRERCTVCGLIARNKIELKDHIEHAHKQTKSENSDESYSEEQKIDPFIKHEE